MYDKFLNSLYEIHQDMSIPLPKNRTNIIMTLLGMHEISRYYKQKYKIDIFPFNANMRMAPQILSERISARRAEFVKEEQDRCAFIFHNMQQDHAMPMVWERRGQKEALFFLDSTQYLGDVSYIGYQCDLLYDKAFEKHQDLGLLPNGANYVYVYTEDKLFYIDKKEKSCQNLFQEDKPHVLKNKLNLLSGFIKANFPELMTSGPEAHRLTEKQMEGLEVFMNSRPHLRGRMALQFRTMFSQLQPNIQLYSCVGKRQIDGSSCTIDALVIAKAGLMIAPSLNDAIQEKIVEEVGGLVLFHLPEALLKTAQPGSFPENSAAQMQKPMHRHFLKNEGKPTGEVKMQSLEEFRAPYMVQVTEKEHFGKFFNTYTIEKGKRYQAFFEKLVRERALEMPEEASESESENESGAESENDTAPALGQ